MPPPFLIDSHCHLDFPEFSEDREAVLTRARAAGVGLMLTISTRVARHASLVALAEAHDDILASVGTHPHNAADEPDVSVETLAALSRHPRIVAIGEAGLDFHHDRAPRDIQETVFRRHIAAARQTALPLIIHARDADAEVARILREETGQGAFPFVLHCFSAGRGLMETGLALGGFISFSGILAFNRSDALRAIAADVPLDRLLIETDAPYLAPPPHRGTRNEPAFVAETARVLARVKGVDLAALAAATSGNVFRLFRKVPDPRPGGTGR